MPEEQAKAQREQRRSQRVLLRVAVKVEGTSQQGIPFAEDTHTLVVNAHGCLLLLAVAVKPGQNLVLTNRTREKQECRVVHEAKMQDGKKQVAMEFLQPSAAFWHIDFPPEDWKGIPD